MWKCYPHLYPISSTLLLKSFIFSSLSWLGIAIRSGKSQGIWIYILLKIVKFLINEACWSFIIYGWGPLNCTRSLCALRKGFVVSFLLGILGRNQNFPMDSIWGEVHFQSVWGEIVLEKNLNFLISFWREIWFITIYNISVH